MKLSYFEAVPIWSHVNLKPCQCDLWSRATLKPFPFIFLKPCQFESMPMWSVKPSYFEAVTIWSHFFLKPFMKPCQCEPIVKPCYFEAISFWSCPLFVKLFLLDVVPMWTRCEAVLWIFEAFPLFVKPFFLEAVLFRGIWPSCEADLYFRTGPQNPVEPFQTATLYAV